MLSHNFFKFAFLLIQDGMFQKMRLSKKGVQYSRRVCLIELIDKSVYLSNGASNVCSYSINFHSEGADFRKIFIKIELYTIKSIPWRYLNVVHQPFKLHNNPRDLKIKSVHFLLILFCLFFAVVKHRKKQSSYNCEYCCNCLKPIGEISAFNASPIDVEELKQGRKGHRNEERYHHSQDKIPFHARLRYRESAKPISLTPGCTGRAWA